MKNFMRSKTIWGALLTILPVIGPAIGLGADDVTLIHGTADQIIQVAGGLLAIYGRFKAGGIKLL